MKSLTARRCAVWVTLLAAASVAGAASLDREVQFNIPAQPLSPALIDFSNQADVQVITRATDISNIRTNGVLGRKPIGAGLRALLAGTEFSFVVVGDKTFEITRNVGSRTATSSGVQNTAPTDVMLVAQVDEKPSSKSSDTLTVKSAEKPGQKPAQLEEVVITGSRIPIAVGQSTAQPVRTYTRETIERSGQSSVADFLNTLPEVSTSSFDSPIGSYADQTTVQLHGLPIGTTLVLLNGRRAEINNYGFFDLNYIPIDALERIEVLPVGSSAIYGADSLAGAVNFVLKDKYNGFDASTRYGVANGMDEFTASVSGGHSWTRGSFSLVGSYHRRSELLGAERAITRDPNNPLATFGQGDICNPGTVYALNGGNLPGLASPMAAIPSGLSGKPTIGDFNATAGTVNRCSANSYPDLLPPLERVGGLASGEFTIAERAVVFSELLVSHEKINSRVGNLISFYNAYGSTLPASNAFNPFGEDIGISYTYPGLPFHYDRTATFVRPLIGLRGDLGGNWSYELTGFWSYDESHVSQNDNYNFTALQASLASSDPATALNPFAQGAPGSPQLLASLFGPPLTLHFKSWDTTAQGILRGPLFHLRSGPVQAVFGAEYDRMKLYTYQQDVAITSAANSSRRNAYSLFTEERVPLLANLESPGNGDKLAIGIAGRYDHADDFGGKSTGQINVEWRPTGSFLFRGGFAMSYQAPQLTQLAGASGSFTAGGYVDPFRGNAPVNNVEQDFGPNPNLKPETGNSRQVGFVYSSKAVPGLRVSLTRWDINISNYIGTPSAQDLIDYPGLFPGAVTRAAPSQQDIQNGFLGPITAIHDVFYNFGDVKVSGVDADIAYSVHTRYGTLTPSVSVTETDKFTSSISPALPPSSSVSKAALSVGFAPRWKGVAAVGWDVGSFRLYGDARYISRYLDYQDFVPNSNELGNFFLADANVRYRLGQATTQKDTWRSRAYVELGAVNVFDRQPQKSYMLSNFDYAEADIRGRFIYLQIGKEL